MTCFCNLNGCTFVSLRRHVPSFFIFYFAILKLKLGFFFVTILNTSYLKEIRNVNYVRYIHELYYLYGVLWNIAISNKLFKIRWSVHWYVRRISIFCVIFLQLTSYYIQCLIFLLFSELRISVMPFYLSEKCFCVICTYFVKYEQVM